MGLTAGEQNRPLGAGHTILKIPLHLKLASESSITHAEEFDAVMMLV